MNLVAFHIRRHSYKDDLLNVMVQGFPVGDEGEDSRLFLSARTESFCVRVFHFCG